MCGFSGFINSDAVQNADFVLDKMLTKITHRGPDDTGSWFSDNVTLGHQRLSIHDLSPLGHQPMHSHSNRYVVIFNGEIYNFAELRTELKATGVSFVSESDTEVLLASVEMWGVEIALTKFVGMFAFALWDKQEALLYLARDRLGEKPLYYFSSDEGFVFGSQLGSLAQHPSFKKCIDREALGLYLRHGYIPAPLSIYQKTYKLMPGHLLTVSITDNGFSHKQSVPYWSLTTQSSKTKQVITDPQQAMKELDALISQSVSLQSKADVPLGAFLSGGIDSSLITAYMQSQSAKPINTFTIGFDNPKYNEALFAKDIARHLGTNHTEHYINEHDLLTVIPKLADIYDEPFADSSQLPTYVVGALARKQVTVALSGDGGDELFCGYSRYQKTFQRWQKFKRIPVPLRSLTGSVLSSVSVNANASDFNFLGKTPKDLIRSLDYVSSRDFASFYKRSLSTLANVEDVIIGSKPQDSVYDVMQVGASSLYDHMMTTDTLQYLPDDILTKVDRAFMASSLEGRIPLLDHRIVEFARSVPVEIHRLDGQGKYLLRELLYKKVPKKMIDRPKMGFAIPLADWLRGALQEWADNLLSPNRLSNDGIFDVDFVSSIWQQHLSGHNDWGTLLWSILMFNSWLDTQ
jgi:asparagine synthase (glutamine-hydrolysing)